jgi:FKBP-type peptidyl-prolyl cis-trans isomerase SlyD
MNKEKLVVSDDIVVTMEYSLKLDDGQEIDNSAGRDPFQFLQGRGQIIPGLEKELYGMHSGDEKKVTVAPADGYGEYDPDNLETVTRDIFPADMDLEEGLPLQLRDANSGEIIQATVSKIGNEKVLLDLNHPLAGETLSFQVKITELRNATAEELDHGHVHTPGHTH